MNIEHFEKRLRMLHTQKTYDNKPRDFCTPILRQAEISYYWNDNEKTLGEKINIAIAWFVGLPIEKKDIDFLLKELKWYINSSWHFELAMSENELLLHIDDFLSNNYSELFYTYAKVMVDLYENAYYFNDVSILNITAFRHYIERCECDYIFK